MRRETVLALVSVCLLAAYENVALAAGESAHVSFDSSLEPQPRLLPSRVEANEVRSTAPAKGAESQTITPRSESARKLPKASEGRKARPGTSGAWSTVASLGIGLGLVAIAATLYRKRRPGASTNLPSDVVQVLGRRRLESRNMIHLVRCGSKILVLGSSQQGLVCLSEITDPLEVDQLTGRCVSRNGDIVVESGTAIPASGFGNLLQRLKSEPVAAETKSTPDDATQRLRDRLASVNSRPTLVPALAAEGDR